MQKTFFTLVSSALLPCFMYAQGMIINEFSNGASGEQEYFEFVVVGATADPTTPVDLSGFVIDDNNGSFEGAVSGVGIANGHFRIKAGCYTAVPPGSIIVLYNANDRNALIPADDPTDANGDGVYIIPHTNSCIEVCATFPSASPTFNASYAACGGSYSATTLTGVTGWSAVSCRNGGDAVQVRRPDYSFYHGFSYGDVGTPFPAFPTAFGGNAFNVSTSSGLSSSYALACGSWASSTSYARLTAAAGTPGAANGTANGNMITNIENGDFNYSNLADADNCLLAIELLKWEGKSVDGQVYLHWLVSEQSTARSFELQRSANGISFETIGQVSADPGQTDYAWVDAFPLPLGYYRLKNRDEDGSIEYSRLLAFEMPFNREENWLLYPNPTHQYLTIEFSEASAMETQWAIVDALGRVVLSGSWQGDQHSYTLEVQDLQAGYYTLLLQTAHYSQQRRWIKY